MSAMDLGKDVHLGRMLFGREAFAFYMVGGLAALAYVVITSSLIHLGTGVEDWIISGLTYAVFMPLVYFAHRVFSFRSDAPHRRAFSRYVVVQIMGLGVATTLSFLMFNFVDITPFIASALVIGLTSVFNFLVLRGWAFAVPKVA